MGAWTTANVCFFVGAMQTMFWLICDADEKFALSILQTRLMFISIQTTCWIFPLGCDVGVRKMEDFGRYQIAEIFQYRLSPQQILMRAIEAPVF